MEAEPKLILGYLILISDTKSNQFSLLDQLISIFFKPNFTKFSNSSKNEYFNSHNLDNRHLLLMFICAHCPFVKYIENQIFTLSKEIENTVQTVAISSNDIVSHPSDSPKNLRLQAQTQGWSFPYLYDENQNFAKKLKAACTPDFYLFSNEGDGDFLLYYHGQLDDSRPGNNIPLSGKDLRSAVKDLIKIILILQIRCLL